MARRLIRLDTSPEATFYYCKRCGRNHIARGSDYISREIKSLDESSLLMFFLNNAFAIKKGDDSCIPFHDASRALFKDAVNFKTAHPKDYWQKEGCTLAKVFCLHCDEELGSTIVSSPPNKDIEGRVVLNLNGLVFWNTKPYNPHLVLPDAKSKNLTEFDYTTVLYFYVCRKCYAHIASSEEFIAKRDNMAWFKDAVNWQANDSEPYCENRSAGYTYTMANVDCTKCRSFLGRRIVALKTPDSPLREGNMVLKLEALRYWNGYTICDADDDLTQAADNEETLIFS